MSFRFSNAPARFKDYINKILAKKLHFFAIVYPDDIFIYTKDPSQYHIKAVGVNFIQMKFVSWVTLNWPKELGWKINKSKR